MVSRMENRYVYYCKTVEKGISEIENSKSGQSEKTGTEKPRTDETEGDEKEQQPFQIIREWAEEKPQLLIGGAVAVVVLIGFLIAVVSKRRKKGKDSNLVEMSVQRESTRELTVPVELTDPVEDMRTLEAPVDESISDGAQESRGSGTVTTLKMETEAMPAAPVFAEKRKSGLYIGKAHNIGRRDSQQDSLGMSRDGQGLDTGGNGILAIVADGMGGMENGGQISAMVTMTMLEQFDRQDGRTPGEQRLLELLNRANEQVNRMIAKSGGRRGGSTVIATLIQGDSLYWLTVGDSHLYLYRNDALLQMNQDHIYAVDLDEKAARGEISARDAAGDSQRKALTSYIGMGKIKKVDRNIRPMKLKDGDRILLMSDGVFGTLSDEEMLAAMRLPVMESGEAIDQMIQKKNRMNQDNYTALILEYVQE